MMDHEQVSKLRADLGISQAELARATGINRTVLSGFETGQLTLEGDLARRLKDYFVHQGVELDEEEGMIIPGSSKSARRSLPRPQTSSVVTEPPSERDQALLAELQSVEQQIRELEPAHWDKDIFQALMGRGREEREALFALLGRWRLLVLMRQGKVGSDPPVLKEPVTHAELLALAYTELRDKGRVSAFSQ